MKILLIDLSSIFWQAWHATKDQELGRAFDITIQKIYRHTNDYDHSAICLDAPTRDKDDNPTPYNRKKIYPAYKAQRDKPTELSIEQFDRLKEKLTSDGFKLFVSKGHEADDVIATLVTKLMQKDEICETLPMEIVILTGDKDLAQLVTSDVEIITTQTGERLNKDGVVAKFGVEPHSIVDFLALVGDKSDNVPGVPRVGPKTACRLLADHVDVASIVKIIKSDNWDPLGTSSIAQSLIDNVDNLEMSYKLVMLDHDADVDANRIFEKEEKVESTLEIDVPNKTAEWVEPDDIKEESIVQPVKAEIVRRGGEWIRNLEPGDSQSAWKLAQILIESRMYGQYRNKEACLAAILRGRELGLGAISSLESFHIVKDKLTMSAQLICGLVMKSDKCKYFKPVHSDDKSATYKTLRTNDPDPDPITNTFTIEQAEKRGLIRSGSNWTRMPEVMLRWRCAVDLARQVYPDVIGGLYSPDEIEEI